MDLIDDHPALGNMLVDTATYSSDERYHRLFSDLRADAPVAWAEPDDYRPFWVVSKAGDTLMWCYPSANRDEDVFDDRFAFRIDHLPNAQLAFGYGPHVCLGQHLAKLEIRIFFEEFLARIDSVALEGDAALSETNFVQGLKSLPIRYTLR